MKAGLNIKLLSLMLCLSAASDKVKAQIISPVPPVQFANGDFELPEANSCINGVPRWNMVSAPMSGSPLLLSAGSGKWIDMAGCSSDNGKYIEQRVSTVPGKLYYIQLDLGTNQNIRLGLPINFWDAGVDVFINGVALNAGSNRVYHQDFGASPKWKTLSTCMFRATASITTVKIAGNGSIVPSPGGTTAPSPGKRVMSLDNVILKKADTISKLSQAPGGDCNKYCFRLESPFFRTTDVYPKITGTRWFIGSLLKNSNDSIFCYQFPETGSHQVMVVFDLKDQCGNMYTDTLKRTVVSEPAETYGPDIAYTLDCGRDSAYLAPGCDGTGANLFRIQTAAGAEIALLPLPLTGGVPGLAPGSYVFTCINWNTPTGCDKWRYTNVTVKPNTAPPGEYSEPDIVLDLPCNAASVNFRPDCPDTRLTHFKISGNGLINGSMAEVTGILSAGATLRLSPGFHGGDGVYRLSCYDEHECVIMTRLVFVKILKESSCDIGSIEAEDCYKLNDPTYIRENLESCPDCLETFNNATWKGPWKTPSFLDDRSSSYRIVSREYIDSANCKKCTVTFWLDWGSAMSSFKYISIRGADCMRIYDADLPPCLQRKKLKMYHYKYKDPREREDTTRLSGEEFTVDPRTGIELCISKSRDYYLYSEEDPCCFMFIKIGTGLVPGLFGKDMGDAAEDGSSAAGLQAEDLKLVPNPASSVFRIEGSNGVASYQRIDILDMNGRTLMTRIAADAQTMIDMTKYAEGIYIVKVTQTNGQIVTLKLVHKKS